MHQARARLFGDHLELRVHVDVGGRRFDLTCRFDDRAVWQAATADFDYVARRGGVAECVGGARFKAVDDPVDLLLRFLVGDIEPVEGDAHQLLQGLAGCSFRIHVAAQRAVERVAGQQLQACVKQRQPDIGAGKDVGQFGALLQDWLVPRFSRESRLADM